MKTLVYTHPILKVPISINITVEIGMPIDNDNIWFSLIQAFLKLYNYKDILNSAENVIINIIEIREIISIQYAQSNARISCAKIIEVTRVYEKKKKEILGDTDFNPGAKMKLIANLDKLLDSELQKLITIQY